MKGTLNIRRNKVLLGVALVAALVASVLNFEVRQTVPRLAVGFAPKAAHADGDFGFYGKNGTSTSGQAMAVYSDTAGVIPDGTICIADTQATGGIIKRFSVKPYLGTPLTRPFCLGVAWGNIPARGNGPGKLLLAGYHANAKMAATGLTAMSLIRVSASVHGAFTTSTDSLNMACGIFISYATNSTAGNSRGKIILYPGAINKHNAP